jgi:hypothetical protein
MEAAFAAASAAIADKGRPIRVASFKAIAKTVIVPGLAAWTRATGQGAEVVVF